MKKPLLLLLAGTLGIFSSSAYTAKDLVNVNLPDNENEADAIEIRYGSYIQRSLHDNSCGMLHVKAIDENTLQVTGMMNGNLWARFTVSGTTVKLQTQYLSAPSRYAFYASAQALTEKPVTGDTKDAAFQTPSAFALSPATVNNYGGYTYTQNWIGTISERPNGFQIDFSTPIILQMGGYYFCHV